MASVKETLTQHGFSVTKEYKYTSILAPKKIAIDDYNKKLIFCSLGPFGGLLSFKAFDFSQIQQVEIVENDGGEIKPGIKKTRSAIGLIGGTVLLGPLGGVAGATLGAFSGKRKAHRLCSKLDVVVYLSDLNTPVYTIKLIAAPMKTDTFTYRSICSTARKLCAFIGYAQSHKYEPPVHTITPPSPASTFYCTQCGTRINLPAQFCSQCGTAISLPELPETPEPIETPPTPPAPLPNSSYEKVAQETMPIVYKILIGFVVFFIFMVLLGAILSTNH